MTKSPFILDALFCTEEDFFIQEDQLCNDSSTPTQHPQLFLEQDLFWEDEELIALFSKEQGNQLYNELDKNPLMAESRRETIDWILDVIEYYSFSHITVVLAVNYLDRFLFSSQLKREKPWMTQLAAVACLSLAAKVEETQVPLLLDLQVEETRYVFEAKTIQRMEILVLSTLQWKMNPVTPISFIDHFARRFGFKNQFCCEFLRRCECLIVFLISDCRFMRFLPSVLATATILHVINTTDPCSETEYQNQLLNTLKIDKDQLDDCVKMISDSTGGFFEDKSNKRKLRSTAPLSPDGLIDICFSSNCSNDPWGAASPAPPSTAAAVSSSPEPRAKKIRFLCNEHGVSSRLSLS